MLREGFHEAILAGFFLWRGVSSTSILIRDLYVGGLTFDNSAIKPFLASIGEGWTGLIS